MAEQTAPPAPRRARQIEQQVRALSAFVPPRVVNLLPASPQDRVDTKLVDSQTVLLFMDVTGCTAIAERLNLAGPDGAERFAEVLARCFEPTVDLVEKYCGEIVRFAGDAVLAAWYADDHGSLHGAARLAASCGRAILDRLDDMPMLDEVRLRLHGGLGCGQVSVGWIAGDEHRAEAILAGPALADMSKALEEALAGQLLVSRTAWGFLEATCEGEPVGSGFTRLVSVSDPVLAPPRAQLETAPDLQALQALVPSVAQRYFNIGQDADQNAGMTGWFAEYRSTSVLFASLYGIDGFASDANEPLQRALQIVQPILRSRGGALIQYMVDDKGTVLIAAWGPPGASYQDNAARAVKAAVQINRELEASGFGNGIGISSGKVFFGFRGNERRREVALIGETVIRAARMMKTAGAGVRCDDATRSQSTTQIRYAPRETAALKGFDDLETLFEPVSVQLGTGRYVRAEQMIGRAEERELVELVLTDSKVANTLVVEAEAGMGKSMLIAHAENRCGELGMKIFRGGASPIGQAYNGWREVIAAALGFIEDEGPQERVEKVSASLAPMPGLLRLSPLLSTLVSVSIPDNDLTSQMNVEVRADNTRKLLLGLIELYLVNTRSVLILEDVHWFDSSAWALLDAARAMFPNLLILLSSRPFETAPPEIYSRLLGESRTRYCQLTPLRSEDTAQLIGKTLGATSVPAELIQLVHERSEGNPFFAEQLSLSIRDSGALALIEDGSMQLLHAGALDELALPDTVEAVVTSRMELLPTAAQLLLKAASVVGRIFDLRTLRYLDIVNLDDQEINGLIEELIESRFVEEQEQASQPEATTVYQFCHAITRDAVYGLLLFEQRRELHHAVGRWYENIYAGALEPHYLVLARHFSQSTDSTRALHYIEKASSQNLETFAYPEAIAWLDQAEKLGETHSVPAARAARWAYDRGEANFHLGKLDESEASFARSLRLRGRDYPSSNRGRTRTLLWHICRQMLQFLVPNRLLVRGSGKSDLNLQTSRVYTRMSTLGFYRQDLLCLLLGTYGSTNYAETAGADREIALGYGGLAVTFGLFGLHPLARIYNRRSLAAAERDGNIANIAETSLYSGTYHYPAAHWQEAERDYTRAAQLFDTLGDTTRFNIVTAARGYMWLLRGNYDQAQIDFETVLADAGGTNKTRIWARAGRLVCQLAQGTPNADEVKELIDLVTGEEIDGGDRVVGCGVAAWCLAASGDLPQASNLASNVHRTMTTQPPTAVYTVFGVHGALVTFLHVGELDKATAVAKSLGVLAFQNVGIRPWAMLDKGSVLYAKGRRRQASRTWRNAAAVAERTALPEVEGRAYLELARYAGAETLPGRDQLQKARSIFDNLGAITLSRQTY